MDNNIISSNGYKIVQDKLVLNFKDTINYFKTTTKGVIKAIINNDESNIIILRNDEEFEIKDLSIYKVEFIRDAENCFFAKVKYFGAVKN